MEKNINDFILNSDKIFSLGIIINELLTNIMKYAFTDMDSGLIIISALINYNHVSIVVADNGVGMPDSESFEKSTGIGMQLMSMLAEQIGGSIRIERGNGTWFVLEFDV